MVHILLIEAIPIQEKHEIDDAMILISIFLINLFFYVDLKLNMLAMVFTLATG